MILFNSTHLLKFKLLKKSSYLSNILIENLIFSRWHPSLISWGQWTHKHATHPLFKREHSISNNYGILTPIFSSNKYFLPFEFDHVQGFDFYHPIAPINWIKNLEASCPKSTDPDHILQPYAGILITILYKIIPKDLHGWVYVTRNEEGVRFRILISSLSHVGKEDIGSFCM